MDELPNELLVQIFTYLPLLSRLAVKQVCKRWKEFEYDLGVVVCLEGKQEFLEALKDPRRRENVTHACLRNRPFHIGPVDDLVVLRHCRKLVHLRLDNVKTDPTTLGIILANTPVSSLTVVNSPGLSDDRLQQAMREGRPDNKVPLQIKSTQTMPHLARDLRRGDYIRADDGVTPCIVQGAQYHEGFRGEKSLMLLSALRLGDYNVVFLRVPMDNDATTVKHYEVQRYNLEIDTPPSLIPVGDYTKTHYSVTYITPNGYEGRYVIMMQKQYSNICEMLQKYATVRIVVLWVVGDISADHIYGPTEAPYYGGQTFAPFYAEPGSKVFAGKAR